MLLRFADCTLDCERFEFSRAGERVDLQPKVWAFLRLLAENPQRVLTKDEIFDRLWPDVAVAEDSLQRLARLARRALGDESLLRTVRGVGYQLVARVERAEVAAGDGAASAQAAASGASQEIRFCRTVDGVNIAWASAGEGRALVRALGWFTNLEVEFAWEHARRFWEQLGEGRRLLRYDGRGMGLSDPWSEFSAEVRLRDLEAVVEASGEETADLLGLSEGCGSALLYARRHPQRVRRLVLYGPPSFLFLERDAEALNLGRVMRDLVEGAWGGGSELFGRMLAQLFVGQQASPQTRELFDRMQRASTDRETVASYLKSMREDVREEASKLEVPTLVLHRRDDAIAPLASAKAAAGLIPGAKLVSLAGDNHWPMADDPGAPAMIRAIRDFLDD